MGEIEGVSGDFHCYGHFCALKIIWRAIAYFGIDEIFSQSVGGRRFKPPSLTSKMFY